MSALDEQKCRYVSFCFHQSDAHVVFPPKCEDYQVHMKLQTQAADSSMLLPQRGRCLGMLRWYNPAPFFCFLTLYTAHSWSGGCGDGTTAVIKQDQDWGMALQPGILPWWGPPRSSTAWHASRLQIADAP